MGLRGALLDVVVVVVERFKEVGRGTWSPPKEPGDEDEDGGGPPDPRRSSRHSSRIFRTVASISVTCLSTLTILEAKLCFDSYVSFPFDPCFPRI